jgi:F0F1-type ATP synthase membrane subunit c/vacuolar-type H+-ATPase subunit K
MRYFIAGVTLLAVAVGIGNCAGAVLNNTFETQDANVQELIVDSE